MSGANIAIMAAAGSGKTTFLVRSALKIKDERVLITTYTESNEAEIRSKFIELRGSVPRNVVVMTWFSFLIAHGVRPFQYPVFDFPVRGMQLVQSASGIKAVRKDGVPIQWGEAECFEKHYFDKGKRVYSDKLAKLVLRCDRESNGDVFRRLERVFENIFIDEVQDLAGRDLDLIEKFFRMKSKILLVGDPRQVTYLTHHERRHAKYAYGRIVDFLQKEIPKKVSWTLDNESLGKSHRNSKIICDISSRLYPSLRSSEPCACESCRECSTEHRGLFLVRSRDVHAYLKASNAVQLRDDIDVKGVHPDYIALNFGISKGRGFDHVLIYPTSTMLAWLKNPAATLKPVTRAKLYVALTRARYSVGVVSDDPPESFHGGFVQYSVGVTNMIPMI